MATSIEDMLRRYTKPSSDSEQQRQDAAEELARDAVKRSATLPKLGSRVELLPKGSYANNTNVKLDSDVDIAVISHEVFYPDYSALLDADQARLKSGPPSSWIQPAILRAELIRVLQAEAGVSNVHPGRVTIQVDAVKSRAEDQVRALPQRALPAGPRGVFYFSQRAVSQVGAFLECRL